MREVLDLEKMLYRSKCRIKNLGEVFTPESYVDDMLDLLAKNKRSIWSDEDISFFEPCSGHGNIVLSIYKRRLEGIYKKAISQGIRDEAYYAVANSINTLWAIDIDPTNIENCRSRVLLTTLDFLKAKLKVASCNSRLFASKKKFFAHLLSAIKWHIELNETLSALSDAGSAKSNASRTKSGNRWFAQNGHHQLDFSLTWVKFFEDCESSRTVPLEYERSLRFVESIIAGRIRGFEDYEFAKLVISTNEKQADDGPDDSVSVGA